MYYFDEILIPYCLVDAVLRSSGGLVVANIFSFCQEMSKVVRVIIGDFGMSAKIRPSEVVFSGPKICSRQWSWQQCDRTLLGM